MSDQKEVTPKMNEAELKAAAEHWKDTTDFAYHAPIKELAAGYLAVIAERDKQTELATSGWECLDMVREVLVGQLGEDHVSAPMFYPEEIQAVRFKVASEILALALGSDDVKAIIDRYNAGERYVAPVIPADESPPIPESSTETELAEASQ